ncbi:IclR family transcriptional regulator [Cognatishimia sp. F0-27]|uniref:IclR family transcriptional regulator n=1 Tax=Cognatishimia sp. F0-27 TaxID=2816855 RepID=UPI001D0CB73C|nr:IclR family transcriptional regulator [Cognatishimia sp. F0-27]MCC1494597.1 IclR family transcriptional regulator [Cognatishimia sp. F0-27]
MPDDAVKAEKGQIPTNLRLLLILEEVAQAGTPVSASALSDALGLPKPTVHRLLATAEDEGFLVRDIDGRSYGPGHRLRRLASNTFSSQRVRAERLMIMTALAEEVEETCNLAAPGRYGMVYLDRVETHWPLRIQLPVGTQVPFHCTASGKMFLSSLRSDRLDRYLDWLTLSKETDRTITDPDQLREEVAAIRGRGFATDNEEFMEGMTAVAAPITDAQGRLMTTLSIHAPLQRHGVDDLIMMLPQLKAATERMRRLLND